MIGLNNENFKYWRDEIFIRLHHKEYWEASMEANLVCHQQELGILKDRIIKLEKKYAKAHRKAKAFKED